MAAPIDPLRADDKTLIAAQEAYRLEIREQLAKDRSAGADSGWSKFLNSSFGLWLLSAVFVSGAGNWYTNRQSELKARATAEQVAATLKHDSDDLIERLDLEISYRLSISMSNLQGAHGRFGDRRDSPALAAIRTALAPLSGPADRRTAPLYPEFASHSGLALMAELRRHLPEAQRQRSTTPGSVGYAITKINGLSEDLETSPETALAVAGKLVAVMQGVKLAGGQARWDNGFYYTDCSRETPFC